MPKKGRGKSLTGRCERKKQRYAQAQLRANKNTAPDNIQVPGPSDNDIMTIPGPSGIVHNNNSINTVSVDNTEPSSSVDVSQIDEGTSSVVNESVCDVIVLPKKRGRTKKVETASIPQRERSSKSYEKRVPEKKMKTKKGNHVEDVSVNQLSELSSNIENVPFTGVSGTDTLPSIMLPNTGNDNTEPSSNFELITTDEGTSSVVNPVTVACEEVMMLGPVSTDSAKTAVEKDMKRLRGKKVKITTWKKRQMDKQRKNVHSHTVETSIETEIINVQIPSSVEPNNIINTPIIAEALSLGNNSFDLYTNPQPGPSGLQNNKKTKGPGRSKFNTFPRNAPHPYNTRLSVVTAAEIDVEEDYTVATVFPVVESPKQTPNASPKDTNQTPLPDPSQEAEYIELGIETQILSQLSLEDVPIVHPSSQQSNDSEDFVDIDQLLGHSSQEVARSLSDLFSDEERVVEEPAAARQDDLNEDELDDEMAPPPRFRVPMDGLPLARRRIVDEESVQVHSCGSMDWECLYCGARYFRDEVPSRGLRGNLIGAMECCANARFRLPPLSPVSELQMDLLTGNHPLNRHFKDYIRAYNSSLAFVSTGASVVPQDRGREFVYRIHGQIYHRISHLHPTGNDSPAFGQLYIIESEMANDVRLQVQPDLNPEILGELDRFLRENNPYCNAYRMLHEIEAVEAQSATDEGREPLRVFMVLGDDRNSRRRDNRPTASNEVAAVYVSNDDMPPGEISYCVYPRHEDNRLRLRDMRSIDDNVDPMSYPLLFPRGEKGWSPNMRYDEVREGDHRPNISMKQFYGYRLSIRQGFNILLESGRLSQQYAVDAWVKVEGSRLQWIRLNQDQLRAELYTGLIDHINNRADSEGLRPGSIVLLPSDFIGSPRCLQQLYQDGLAAVRHFGPPDLFITFTTNPNWPEIRELLNGQSPSDRPDLLARVFYIKMMEFIKDIYENQIFGEVAFYCGTVEFQKRGLAHLHILVILKEEFKPRTPDIIDQIVCAEIPDPQQFPRLYDIVENNMIHNPCGIRNQQAPCMSEGSCTKHFPKPFSNSTIITNSYPLYRRRNDGRYIEKRGHPLDNRWVVPYNPFLSLKYHCHINVEICTGILGMKYIYKYIYKGEGRNVLNVIQRRGDLTMDGTIGWDEVTAFEMARYVGPVEGHLRLQGKKISLRSHAVRRLPVHLPGQQNVIFREGQEEAALNRARVTELTDWFRLNREDPNARQYLYHDIPYHYIFSFQTGKRWRPRRRRSNIIVRMHHVSPRDSERFHLRMLLLHVRGAMSFEDVRTVDGIEYPTFLEAARARNLVRNDEEWIRTLEEAASFQMPRQLRFMFAVMCAYCELPDALLLWERFRDQLAEDYLNNEATANMALQYALRDIESTLVSNGRSLEEFGLPSLDGLPDAVPRGVEVDIDVNEEELQAARNIPLLNRKQSEAFDRIVSSVYDLRNVNDSACFFLQGAAGTGKTFLYNTLLSYIRGRGDKAIACAYTGIAATLLKMGRTINSVFKLPLHCHEASSSSMKMNSPDAMKLRQAKLIILDEVTMMNKFHLNIIDSLLKVVMGNYRRPFGGKCILFGGDFRQTLPVIPGADKATVLAATIKASPAFRYLSTLLLDENMRAAPEEQWYSQFLLEVGNGTLRAHGVESEGDDALIQVPPECLCDDLITEIFGETISAESASEYVQSAILSPKNNDTDEMNGIILDRLIGEEIVYVSVDKCDNATRNEEDLLNVPAEFLHTLTPSGFPPHLLRLKVGCIVMLLRNLDVSRGLVNGTRLKVNRLGANYVEAVVLTGIAKDQTVFLTRIELTESNSRMPFNLKRRQFPLRVSYCMTINKSQGQTLSRVGLYLPAPVFSHGQLYVALSRARSLRNVKIFVENGTRQGQLATGEEGVFTPNVVWREVL